MQPANIGVVSFKNMPADAQGGTTVTVLFTQASATTGGVGNTTFGVGLGTDCTVIPSVNGSAQTGISTRAFVGGGTTFVGLSTTPGDKEFVSFFVHYNGGTILMLIVTTFSLPRTDSLDLVPLAFDRR